MKWDAEAGTCRKELKTWWYDLSIIEEAHWIIKQSTVGWDDQANRISV